MVSKKAKNTSGAKDLMKYLATPDAELLFLKSSPNNVATHKDGRHLRLQPAAEEVRRTCRRSQAGLAVLDRDTRPDFASTVMIPSLQSFINNPNDVDGLVKSIEDQKKTIFTT
jgi:multiple sugar transport system substrate-binding protein